jgi:hypothetical protein
MTAKFLSKHWIYQTKNQTKTKVSCSSFSFVILNISTSLRWSTAKSLHLPMTKMNTKIQSQANLRLDTIDRQHWISKATLNVTKNDFFVNLMV